MERIGANHRSALRAYPRVAQQVDNRVPKTTAVGGGDINGFGAEQLWLPNDSLRVVVFINSFNGGPANLAEDVARSVLNLPPCSVAGLVAPATRAAVAGAYARPMPTGDTVRMILWSAGERLMAKIDAPSQQAFPLSDRGDGEFSSPGAPNLRIRVEVENGRGMTLELRQNALTLKGLRVEQTGVSAPADSQIPPSEFFGTAMIFRAKTNQRSQN